MSLQIRRGTAAEVASITPDLAEPIYVTDTEALVIGDGVTQGGNIISANLQSLDISQITESGHSVTQLYDENSTGTIRLSNLTNANSLTVGPDGTVVTGPLSVSTTATVDKLATSGNIDGSEGAVANMTGFRAGWYGGTAGYAFKNDVDTGMFSNGTGDLRFKINNNNSALVDADGWSFQNSVSVTNTATVATLKFGDGTTMTTAATGGGNTFTNLVVTSTADIAGMSISTSSGGGGTININVTTDPGVEYIHFSGTAVSMDSGLDVTGRLYVNEISGDDGVVMNVYSTATFNGPVNFIATATANELAIGDPVSSQLNIYKTGSVFKIGSENSSDSIRIDNHNYLYLEPQSAVIINEGNPGQSFLNVNTIRPAGTYTAVTVASTLTVTGNATANSIVTQDLVSSGGFPLNDSGMALIRASNTQTPAMVVSNYTAGLLPEVVVRGYGQNRPGGATSTTNGAPAVILESSRGTHTAPTTLAAADFIGSFSAGGYNGTRWSSDVNLYSAELIATAAGATWAGNATTTTNAGARFFMRIQPPNVQLNTTSRVVPYTQTWTGAASTATGSPPVLTISEGSGLDGNTPTLTPTGGVGSLSTGHGRVNLVKMNTNHQIFGVPQEDTAADNPTLPGTNIISFISGRRSGTSGRRNKVLLDDTLGELRFAGQTTDNASSTGATGAAIYVTAAENFGASAAGSTIKLMTTPIGTNAGTTNRLVINSTNISHSIGGHDFSDTSGNSIASLSTSTAQFFVPVTFPVYTVATKPTTGSVGQQICISDSAGGGNPNGMMAFWDTTSNRWSYIHDNAAV